MTPRGPARLDRSRPVTSASRPTSTRARPPRPSACSIYSRRDQPHGRGRTTAPPSPTGWSRSRSAGSASPRPRPRSRGTASSGQPGRHPRPRRLHDRGRAVAARARRRDRRVLRGQRGRAAERDRVAPGRPLPASRASPSSTSATGPAPIPTRSPPRCGPGSAPTRSSSSCRIGLERRLQRPRRPGPAARSRVWDDEAPGRRLPRRRESRPTCATRPRWPRAEAWSSTSPRSTTSSWPRSWPGRRSRRGRHARRAAPGHHLAGAAVPVLLRRGALQQRGVHNLLDAVVDLPAVAGGSSARSPASTPDSGATGDPPGGRRRSRPRRARVQGHERRRRSASSPTSGSTPGALRTGDQLLNATQGQARAIGRLVRMHANHREDVSADRGRHDRRRRRAARPSPPATPCATRPRPSCSTLCASPSRSSAWPSRPATADGRRPAPARARRPGDRGPIFRVKADAEIAADHHLGHGRAPPRDPGRPPAPRVRGRRHRGPAPGRLPRDHDPPAEAERTFVREVGGPRASTATSAWWWSRRPAAAGYVFENQAPTGRGPQGVRAAVAGRGGRGGRARGGRRLPDDRPPGQRGRRQPPPRRFDRLRLQGGGVQAFRPRRTAAAPTVLEPVMALEVVTPDDDRRRRPRRFQCQTRKRSLESARPGVQAVACFVPLASMFGYATDLRSRTQGRATLLDGVQSLRRSPHRISRRPGRARLRRLAATPQSTRRAERCRRKSSSATSRTSTSGRSVTWTTARPR